MELYEIYWYPITRGDCEKESTSVLCNNLEEAKQIARKCFGSVRVVEIQKYADIAGGRKGEDSWARYVMYKGDIYPYYQYKKLISKQ